MTRYSWFFAGAVGMALASQFLLDGPPPSPAAAGEAAKDAQLVRLYVRILGTSG